MINVDQSFSEEPATVTGSQQHVPPCEDEKMTEEQQDAVEQYREQQTDVKSKSVPAAKQTGQTFFQWYFFPDVLFYPGSFFHWGTSFPGVLFFEGGGGGGGGGGVQSSFGGRIFLGGVW